MSAETIVNTESIESIDRLIDGEQDVAAREAIDQALAADPDPETRFRLEVRRSRLRFGDRTQTVDEAILDLEALLADDTAHHGPELPRVHALRITGYARKRCRGLGERAVEVARGALGPSAAVEVAAGDLALAFDERAEARARYERARELDPDAPRPRLALANLLYVLGDFDGCHALLEGSSAVGRDGAAVWRLRAASYAARDDHAGEARAWRRVLELVPKGDRRGSDGIGLALALASGGDRGGCLETLRSTWRDEPDSGAGRYARARIEHLERAPDAPSKRLTAFPTVAQKWNYCGPAVIELCFRYLSLDMRQDEIADAVKREGGTPMFEIGAFLRRHGIVARRIAATPERLRAAIDLDIPVIVQEEYSTTSHVALITGYDAALGVFFSADPATHRPIVKPFEWTERAGDLFGNGGLVVLGREGPETDELCLRADEAGLVEEAHLAMLDRCSELRPSVGGGGATLEEAAAEEVLRLCDRALALESGFKLAWHRRTWARMQLYRRHGTPALRDALLRDLYVVRTSFPDDEWPHQLHGQWLLDEGRFHEAFVEYYEAWRRDPDDADDLQLMGEAMWLAGDLAPAEKHLLEALAAEAHNERAAENLACVYVRQLQELDADGADHAWGPASTLPPAEVVSAVERDPEDLRRRAHHFSRIALAQHGANPFNHEVAGFLAAREGDHERAEEAFRRASEIAPGRPWPVFQHARALAALDRAQEAHDVLEKAVAGHPGLPRAWLEMARRLADSEAPAEAADVLARGMQTLRSGQAELAEPFFRTASEAESRESAAARLREIAEAQPGEGELLREVAHLLDRNHQRGHAIALLRHVIEVAPGDVSSLYRLGQLLSEDLLTRDEGRAMLQKVLDLVPDSPLPRIQLAWAALDTEPEAGLALLEPVRDQEHPGVYDVECALLERLGRGDEAERALRLALAAYGSPVRGLISLCWQHVDGNRYDRAVRLAQRLDAAEVPREMREPAESVFLTTHRLAGRVREIRARIEELCSDGVPEHLAWEVYWAMRSLDHALAARAALVRVEHETDPVERLEWRIRAAEELAESGDTKMLEEVASEATEDASALANLSWAYVAVERWDDANDAARRAMEVDAENRDALTAIQEAQVRQGDLEAALATAQRLLELHPYEHQGAERLGILLGKSLEVQPALEHSSRAVDAAPFCHVSQRSRAIALFAAGDVDGAKRHAERAAALEEPDEDDPGEEVAILAAVDGDSEGLERCLAAVARHGHPDVFPRWGELLREVCQARASAEPGRRPRAP